MKANWKQLAAASLTGILWASGVQAACLGAETEPNNTDTAANVGLCSNVNITGSVSSSSDLDWYKVVITTPGQIAITLSHGSNVDFDWFFTPPVAHH